MDDELAQDRNINALNFYTVYISLKWFITLLNLITKIVFENLKKSK